MGGFGSGGLLSACYTPEVVRVSRGGFWVFLLLKVVRCKLRFHAMKFPSKFESRAHPTMTAPARRSHHQDEDGSMFVFVRSRVD